MELYQSKAKTSTSDDLTSLQHVDLLIDFISFLSLLGDDEITYDLLWALFKPHSKVYTTCSGTGKPQCVMYDNGEEEETIYKDKYYSMECRYLDYNGQVFGEASINVPIAKFSGRRRSDAKGNLNECGRKFVSLLGARHLHCRGAAF